MALKLLYLVNDQFLFIFLDLIILSMYHHFNDFNFKKFDDLIIIHYHHFVICYFLQFKT